MIEKVIWPPEYDPRHSAIYALNDIDVKAPPEVVWKLLVDAENWSSYFSPEKAGQDLRRWDGTGAHKIHPRNGWLSNEPHHHRVRALPQTRMGNDGRRRRDRVERLPRMGYHCHR
jgi:hypothetical protein